MWFVYSLLTIVFWGGSDLFSKMGTKPKDGYSHWRVVIMVGLIMGLHAAFSIIFEGVDYQISSLITYLPVSFLYILSMVLGYAGLRYIELSLSSPICNCSGAVAAILVSLFIHEWMTGLQFFAVTLITGGLVALSIIEKRVVDERRSLDKSADAKYTVGFLALLFPLLYCVIDGLGTAMDGVVLATTLAEEQANISYELTFLLVAACAFLYLRVVRKQRFNLWEERVFGLGGLCETAGQYFYIYAMGANPVVSPPLIASYSLVSILLSRVFLKEKLRLVQYVVIGVIMIGIAILGLE